MLVFQKSNKKASNRQQINIKEVRDDILILPGNKHRALVEVSSINFELKSDAEQDAIIDTYKSFLNSLDFELQILLRVRELDMDKYLEDLKLRSASEKQPVYKDQICNYSEFVSKMVVKNKILSRHFYIVIPLNVKDIKDNSAITEQLNLRVDIVSKGLRRLGMHTRRLNNLEILDLFYSFYNQKQAKLQPVTDSTLRLLKEAVI